MRKVYGPYFFVENTVNGVSYLDVLEFWLMPQLQELPNIIFQQDGAPPHFHNEVHRYLNNQLPRHWIGRGCDEDNRLIPWPPRSPDHTPCDFFLWGYITDAVFVPPMPSDLNGLKRRIRASINTIDGEMLRRMWQELDYLDLNMSV